MTNARRMMSARERGDLRLEPEIEEAAQRSYRVPAISRALAVIELFARSRRPLTLSAVSRAIGIPKSSCLSILSTLESCDYIRRFPDHGWGLTFKVYSVGMEAAAGLDILTFSARILERLRDETGLTAHLALPLGNTIVYAQKVEASGIVRFDTYPGKVASLHHTAVAPAILAYLEPSELESFLSGYRFTGGTNAAAHTRREYEERLAEIRNRGYAGENEEGRKGVGCLAAPVFDFSSHVIGSVGLTGLSSDIGEHASVLGEKVMKAARDLSLLAGAAS